ncbi:Uncharacterised protein [Vibrio cholerae]|nr:Uncharacterised protein [Vibrio cholerae]CSC90035.1 Uncharacterised protein [Vibrio cholerae]
MHAKALGARRQVVFPIALHVLLEFADVDIGQITQSYLGYAAQRANCQ